MIDNSTFERRLSEANSFTLDGEPVSKELIRKIGVCIPLTCNWREDMRLNVNIDYGEMYGAKERGTRGYNGMMELIQVDDIKVSQELILDDLYDDLVSISRIVDEYEISIAMRILAHDSGVAEFFLYERMNKILSEHIKGN